MLQDALLADELDHLRQELLSHEYKQKYLEVSLGQKALQHFLRSQ